MSHLRLVLCLLPMVWLSCTKVPIRDVDAGFWLADATWFGSEETLFLFWGTP